MPCLLLTMIMVKVITPLILVFSTTARIGDFVWNDADGDGIQDGGETGINGVNR